MAPTGFEHGDIEGELTLQLRAFARQHRLGRVVSGEVGIYIRRDPDRIRAADVALFTNEQVAALRPKSYATVAPELVVEIVSPNDAWEDIRAKLRDYFSIGVNRVWVVEPDTRAVLIYSSPSEVIELAAGDLLRGEGVLEGFELPVATIFAE